jgi:ATP-dependent helicase HrpB
LNESDDGDVLVFLPGQREIRRVAGLLAGRVTAAVVPLYGDLPQADQDRALKPSEGGGRKIVLATAVAETSLTIPGVRVVVDGGRMRLPRFDPATGMTRLETVIVSRASADQRRGRAGRLGPGLCYRLWSEAEDRALTPHTPPEILAADLAPLALDLARWGAQGADGLAWLDPPPAASLASARALLAGLGAVDSEGRITAHGKAMHDLGLHPRLAHMCLVAAREGMAGLACDIAALLSERDILKGARDTDLRTRLEILRRGRVDGGADAGAVARVRAASRDWRRRLRAGKDEDGGHAAAGSVLALAYPDRIARRRADGPRYALSGGGGAVLDQADPLAASDWLVAAELDGDRREARIFLAAALTPAEIEARFGDTMIVEEAVAWDARDEAVTARRRRLLGRLAVEDRPLANPDPALVRAAMAAGIRSMGLECLPWSPEAVRLRRRVEFAARLEPDAGWPDWSDAALAEGVDAWLGAALDGVTRRAHLARIDLAQALATALGPDRRRLDALAPTHIAVASGSRVAVEYGEDVPVLAVRLQEMFGCADTPRVGNGRVPVLLHLLSPAHRPVQVTADLAGFWKGAYASVKADMKGRYPRHSWPDDPLTAPATARAKPRGR